MPQLTDRRLFIIIKPIETIISKTCCLLIETDRGQHISLPAKQITRGLYILENQLFRQKSLNRISSPEELHDYMRVTSPKLWMILGAIAVLLIGFIVYASTATMENTMPIKVEVSVFEIPPEDPEGDSTFQYYVFSRLPDAMLDTVKTGMKVRIGKKEGVVIGLDATLEGENAISLIIDMENDRLPLQDGIYDAELVLESTTPISFLWN